MSTNFDLLGDPIPEGHGKRGRPPHLVTEEKRRTIIQLLAFGWTIEKIAAALNCTPPTLRKNYFRELAAKAEAKARVEAKLISSLMAEAEAGNVSAIDKYLKRLDRSVPAPLQQAKPTKAAKLGKKEAALEDAKTAHEDTGWGGLLPN
jgi:IS30 family transposase